MRRNVIILYYESLCTESNTITFYNTLGGPQKVQCQFHIKITLFFIGNSFTLILLVKICQK